jgi:phosphopantetheinyl transferase
MRMFLCDAGSIPQDVLKKAAQVLPESRMPSEGIRADAFAARVVGTLLATYAAKQISPETVCEKWGISPQGKPCFESSTVQFSISHAHGIVGVAVSNKSPVGLDIEKVRPMREGFATRYFNESERQLIRAAQDPYETLIQLWTAKEAVGKQRGTGLGENIPAIDTQNTTTTAFEKNGARFALSVAPKCGSLTLEWVDFENLVP